jgi:PET Domain
LPPQIEAYFHGVPAGKVPRAGSTGDKYRDRQLAWQLPKQDLALAYCKHVEPQHHASYEDFINARNEIALDIAYVTDTTPFNVVRGGVVVARRRRRLPLSGGITPVFVWVVVVGDRAKPQPGSRTLHENLSRAKSIPEM